MTVISITSEATSFDILDEFGRVFWKDMDRETVLESVNKLGTMYRVVPATGLDYGTKA